MENESEMKKKYTVLHKRIGNIESQLNPILQSGSTETSPPDHVNVITDKIDSECDFITKLITAEMYMMKSTQVSDQADAHHLADMIIKVQLLQSTCRAWKDAMLASSGVESSEAPVCSYYDSYGDYDNEEGSERCNYDDQEEVKELSSTEIRMYDNPAYVVSGGDDQDGVVNYEGAEDDSEDQVEEETVKDDDSETEEECISDDQNEMSEFEGTREDKTVRVCDQKEKKTEIMDMDGNDDYGTRNYYRIFWVVLIGTGIISVISGFSDFLDNQSSVVFLTPT